MEEQKIIMDENSITRTLSRLAHEIIETNPYTDTLCLVGVKTRGLPIAKKLAENIMRFSDIKVLTGELDITLYRDDITDESVLLPHADASRLDFDVKDKVIVLVDDVLYTGRTVRAAIDAIIKAGRPSKIKLCVLVDRGHRELPIRGDYVGKNVPTSHNETVSVKMPETDGIAEVVLTR